MLVHSHDSAKMFEPFPNKPTSEKSTKNKKKHPKMSPVLLLKLKFLFYSETVAELKTFEPNLKFHPRVSLNSRTRPFWRKSNKAHKQQNALGIVKFLEQ